MDAMPIPLIAGSIALVRLAWDVAVLVLLVRIWWRVRHLPA